MWLATGAPNGQVRAIASFKLVKLAARLKAEAPPAKPNRRSARCWPPTSSASWIVRPTPLQPMPAPDAPPGAPIGGDSGMDWLAPAPRGTPRLQ